MKRICAMLCAIVLVCVGMTAVAEGKWLDTVLGGDGAGKGANGGRRRGAHDEYVAMLEIYGEISASDYEYDHYGTLEAIEELVEDEDNIGLILLMDTPGGSAYEMDEVYHALMTYRGETGRPVYAYMEQECCSAGVYIAMAAECIYAARMTLTGSVGVYMEESSYGGLMEKLGVTTEYIVTGENKVSGQNGLSETQRAILQGIVDESFGFFKDAIALARGAEVASNEELLDGRLLTAYQALDIGLIDGVMYYEEAIDAFYELGRFGDVKLVNVTPDPWYESFMSGGWNDSSEDWTEDSQPGIGNEDVEGALNTLLDFFRGAQEGEL